MAVWKTTKGKTTKGPNGAKRTQRKWRLVLPDGTKSEWRKGKAE